VAEYQKVNKPKTIHPPVRREAQSSRNARQHNPMTYQLALANPQGLSAPDILQLQHAIGNQAVMQLLKNSNHNITQLATTASPKTGNGTGLPSNLRNGVESLSGHDLSNVRVHYNSSQPVQLGALAYTQGSEIHVAPGQERHLSHEAWHVVQQAQGRVSPTTQMNGFQINDNEGLEREATEMGNKALNADNGGSRMTPSANMGETGSRLVQTKPVLQGYFTGAASATTDTTALSGQDRQADNSFRDPTDINHKDIALSTKDPTGADSLKISEDGKLAIENTDGNRQAKLFFGETSVVDKSNKELLKRGSKYILQVKSANAITVPDTRGKNHSLAAIEPVVNPDAGKKSTMKKVSGRLGTQVHGNSVSVKATCIAVAESIMNKRYGSGGSAKLNANMSKLGLKTSVEQGQWAAALADAITKNGKRKRGNIDENTIAQAYGQFVNANPKAALKVAKALQINEFADPKVGEAFISESVGMPGPNGITNWLVDPTGATDTALLTDDVNVRGGKKRTGWGNHAGAVVAESASNKITLENYARKGEDPALVDSDEIFYFAMYGPASKPEQTWHGKWSKGNAPIANAITGILS